MKDHNPFLEPGLPKQRARPAVLPIFRTFLRDDILFLEVSDTNVLFLEGFLLLPVSPASRMLLGPVFLLQLPCSQWFPTTDSLPSLLDLLVEVAPCTVLLAARR